MTKGPEELHFRIAFCSTHTFAEQLSAILSKAKYEILIHNSAKRFFLHEKMKKCFSSRDKILLTRDLATKNIVSKKIKQTIVYHKMNLFTVHYHRKIEQNLQNDYPETVMKVSLYSRILGRSLLKFLKITI